MVKISRRKNIKSDNIINKWLVEYGDQSISDKIEYQLLLAEQLNEYVKENNLNVDDISYDLKLNINEVHGLLSGMLNLELELLMRIKNKYKIYNEY